MGFGVSGCEYLGPIPVRLYHSLRIASLVWVSLFRVWGLVFGVFCLGVLGFGFRGQCSVLSAQCSVFGVRCPKFEFRVYMGTSLRRKRPPLGPYRRPMPMVLGGS